MEPYLRRQAILEVLHEAGWVQVDDLAARLAASPNTIRNDLNALAAEGLVRRVRGGAALVEEPPGLATPTAPRPGVSPAEAQLACWAAGMVEDGDAIALDSSPLALELAACLRERHHLTVVAAGLDAALLLAQNPSNKVILAATMVSPAAHAVVGRINPDLADGFYVSRAFISPSGLSIEAGLTEMDVDAAEVKAHLVRIARETVVLAGHALLGRTGTARFAGLGQIGHLVTDARATDTPLADLREAVDCPITVVHESGTETFHPGVQGRARQYRIGFANLSERIDFARQVREGLERAARRMAGIELLLRSNELDPQVALDNAQWFVDQDVELAIEYQVNSRAGNVIMDRFRRAGIPVIAVDIPLPGSIYFGSENYRAGHLAGEGLGAWVSRHWRGTVDLLLELESSVVGAVNEARLQGQRDGLESVIGPLSPQQVRALDAPVVLEEAIPFVSSLLPDLPRDAHIAVIALNDDGAVGALLAFEAAGRLDQVAAVGQGAGRLARAALCRPNFPFAGSTMFAPEGYGERLLELAVRILDGHPVPPAVYSRHVLITPDNLSEYYPGTQDVLPNVAQVRALIDKSAAQARQLWASPLR